MTTHIAFLRAINVGGRGLVRMTDVRDAFSAAGCRGVRSYIQSGNVVFDSPPERADAVVQKARGKLKSLLGQEPEILVRTLQQLEGVMAAAPFEPYETDRRIKRYVAFLARAPRIKPKFPIRFPREALEAVAFKRLEVFVVSRQKKSGFYGFPNNFVEKEFGVPATSRNWSTLTKIVAFARAAPGS